MSINKPKIYIPLLPFAYIYGLIVKTRNKLFDYNILKSRSFDIPVICVGNISVGGTGKTPHTEYLIRLLKDKFTVNVLSRGYKRKSKGFVLAQNGKTGIEDIGDEPFQMWTKFPGITVAVDSDRCNGIEKLTKHNNGKNVIILDDAFQHRYVKAGMNILLIDYNRPIHNDAMLPAGRLRESEDGKKRADIIIVTKCPKDMHKEEKQYFIKAISPTAYQEIFFTVMEYGNLYNIFTPDSEIKAESLDNNYSILLITGIASPKAIIDMLSEYCKDIKTITYSDHHNFSKDDIQNITNRFSEIKNEKKLIITTEKDAARLKSDINLDNEIKKYIYALPIEVRFLDNAETVFNHKITEYVRKNSRNSSLS